MENLYINKLISQTDKVKILGNGELKTKLTFKVNAVSEKAKTAIEAAGGTVEILSNFPKFARRMLNASFRFRYLNLLSVKKLIKTLKNIWSIEELRSKILFTLALIFVYSVGAHIVLPGIDPDQLAGAMANSKGGILGLIDTFAGGAFSQASIFALGIMPYISASIFMQLMTVLVPQMQKLRKKVKADVKRSTSGHVTLQ